MLIKAALSAAVLCSLSAPALANCTATETASVQQIFAVFTSSVMNGGNAIAAIGEVQSKLNSLPLSPSCKQQVMMALTSGARPLPQQNGRPSRPGPADGLPGCVGGVCSTPDNDFRAIR